jgi:hypothetical protein
VSVATGIDPLALRDCAVVDALLFDEVAEIAGEWTPELELAASTLEVTYALLRATATLPGGKKLPPLAVPRSRRLAREPRRVSIAELSQLTGRDLVEVGGDE